MAKLLPLHDMARVLILFAHPALHRSRVNLSLMKVVQDLEDVTFVDLYEEYPNLHIDYQQEQERLLHHDVIIWQHPFYWYSTPAILKEWMDVVLEHGFAYGQGGRQLVGKKLMSTITVGGLEESYHSQGTHRYTMREFLAPMDQTAHLCGMHYLEPFIIHGSQQLSDDQLQEWARRYRQRIEQLRDHG